MQNAAFAALRRNWRYLACDVHPDDLPEAILGAKAMKWIGLNLTVPHKLLAVSLVDVLDDSSRRYGAVNTIRFETRDGSGTWQPLGLIQPSRIEEIRSVGFNTDADAIARSIREDLNLELAGASVLLLGAGGAGQVAARKLAEAGANPLFLVNRTRAKAEIVATEIRQQFPETRVTVGYPGKPIDLILHATSLGLKTDDPLPFASTDLSLSEAGAVYDMVYRPAQTALLCAAKAAGCKVANGLGMLLYQGAKALEIWTADSAPIPVMKRALEENIYGT
jgi:shikimate dehydrogenase